MKLELKHLAPYLPYGLRIEIEKKVYPRSKSIGELTIKNIDQLNIPKVYDFKPVLRPISDLTRPELESAGFEDHIDWLTNELAHWVKLYGLDYVIKETPFGHVLYLLGQHYDVFGLIPAGLAIDINTL